LAPLFFKIVKMADKPRVKDKNGSGKVDPGNVYNYLREKGVSHNHALGMMANINAESGFMPTISEKGGGSGRGLFQHSGGRTEKLLNYVNGDLSNWKKQIDFALSETDSQKYLKKDFSNAESAGEYFMTKWERPQDQSQEAIAKRMSWLKTFGGGKYADPNYTPTGSDSVANFEYNYNSSPTIVNADHFEVVHASDYDKKTAEFKKDLAVEKEKNKKIETDVATKELTAAQLEHNKRIEFLNVFNAPKEDSSTRSQEQPQEVSNTENLYTQDLGFEAQDVSTPLFSTTLNTPQKQETFRAGGAQPTLNSILDINNLTEFRNRYNSKQ
jgi:hypothetical protein